MNATIPKPLDILGIPVTPFDSYEHVSQCIARGIEEHSKMFVVAINPEKIYGALSNNHLKTILNRANMQICDGVGTAIATKILYGKSILRITGVSLFYTLIKEASRKQWSVFLLGAKPEVNNKAAEILERDYPKLKIAGKRDGYFKDSEEVVQQINDSGADLLFIALGSPRQEEWIIKHQDQLNVSLCMGVGGTFDVVSGNVKWAPAFFRKTGTEFLYRLLSQPSRIKRQRVLPLFLFRVIRERFSRIVSKKA